MSLVISQLAVGDFNLAAYFKIFFDDSLMCSLINLHISFGQNIVRFSYWKMMKSCFIEVPF